MVIDERQNAQEIVAYLIRLDLSLDALNHLFIWNFEDQQVPHCAVERVVVEPGRVLRKPY
ncbi:hypothetical protein Maq22A_c23010 [Methylobacterium aquaticum]|uniref:Uncharacterized protein n=1 Tax=Methylobacterium aquaticum TaxID=270351 RepID=A0A0C6FQJ2_9HYPH|nr:hypothetical protein Maq22A_c23010 [Methylobacterium aquaticum]